MILYLEENGEVMYGCESTTMEMIALANNRDGETGDWIQLNRDCEGKCNIER